jgi:rRNA processing protein Gar1
MPEIKHVFSQGKMNKDLDERLVPNGQYRHALNVQISSSEGSDVGTVQNILGNTKLSSFIGVNPKCVGAIADDKNNALYWFVKTQYYDFILEYKNKTLTPVLVDVNKNVLKFTDNIITGINIIDDLLFWTDNYNEPKKININFW